ncbi:MAG: alpha/beta hydrolase [Eubacteriales bacterium]
MQTKKLISVLVLLGIVAASLPACSSAATATTTSSTTIAAGTTIASTVAAASETTAAAAETTAAAAMPGKGGKGSMMGGASVDTSSITQKWLDVAYASVSDAEKMDIYLPNDGTGPFPVIIAIHGGAFMSGDKTGELAYLTQALKSGYAVVSINYRLSGEAIFPAAINDVKAAIRFLRANADTYNLDTDKMATWGGSAGGNLAALAATSGGVTALQDDTLGNAGQSDAVQACIDWFGPINFTTMDDQFTASGIAGQVHNTADSPESAYLGALITSVPDLVAACNPETYITKDDPAFFIQHGTADILIPTQQSIDFAAKLTAVLGADKVTYESLEGAGHGDAAFTTTENVAKAIAFLDSVLK